MERKELLRFFFITVMTLLATFSVTLYIFRSQAIENAKNQAHTISEITRDTLTSYMVMGVTDRRDEFLSRIRKVGNVQEIRVVRAEGVIKQFGKGTTFEVPKDEIERAVLEDGKPKEIYKESFKNATYKIVIPYKAEPAKDINCLQCHSVQPGEVLGAIAVTIDLTQARIESLKMSFWIFGTFLAVFGLSFFFFRSLDID